MSKIPYPAIDITSMADTKNILHAYARLMGNWLRIKGDEGIKN